MPCSRRLCRLEDTKGGKMRTVTLKIDADTVAAAQKKSGLKNPAEAITFVVKKFGDKQKPKNTESADSDAFLKTLSPKVRKLATEYRVNLPAGKSDKELLEDALTEEFGK